MSRSEPSSKNKRGPEKPSAAAPDTKATGPLCGDHDTVRSFGRILLIAALVLAGVAAAAALALVFPTGIQRDPLKGADTAATFVGSEACAGCHRPEAELWRGSQHKQAMDHASDKSVLGDFNSASFDYHGVHSRFFRRDGKFLVETDGPDGKLATFEVKYTFGVDPLQQYLVEFPDGRVQALSLAWDSRPKQTGGQRWFHLYPNEEIRHDDILHWTKLNQNWNYMCAECHSTGVRKNYDAATDRFATTFAEINVGCEACHGPASRHLAWARERQAWWPSARSDAAMKGFSVRFDERSNVTWPIDPKSGNATRSELPFMLRKETETCGFCHARRGQFSETWLPGRWLSQTHAVAALSRGLFQADGQLLDEVYNYASFKQSKMFAGGVTCSDCHEPHSAKVRVAGDALCLQCHASDKYSTPSHSQHTGVSPAITCASCHMPTRTYMVVDRRHDHSFRIPRPDISARLGTSNACTDCHTEKSAAWAASAVERWHGPTRKGLQNYAAAFDAAWAGRADAAALLAQVAGDRKNPAIARATALAELGSRLTPSNIGLARSGLADADPMVRIGALDMLQGAPITQRWSLASALLTDAVQGVRLRAVSLLAGVETAQLSAQERERFEQAAREFVEAMRVSSDRPEAHSMLGTFYAQRRATNEAEAEFKAALRLSPQYTPAAINLADHYRLQGREGDAEGVLRGMIGNVPQDAGVHHALGLTLVRTKRLEEAIGELGAAAELAPEQARYAYVYAVALNSAGRGGEALPVLQASLRRHPEDRDTLLALVSFSRQAGDMPAALGYAQRLARIAPSDSNIANLIKELERQVNGAAKQ